jgi:hypothetical protein
MVSWWRGLPARAWTTGFRRDGRAEGRMPTAPWEASSGVRRISGTATGGPDSPAAGAASETAAAGSAGPRYGHGPRPRFPVTESVTDRTDSEHHDSQDLEAAAGTATGSAAASSAGARDGHGIRPRPPVTGSVTDRTDSEHHDSQDLEEAAEPATTGWDKPIPYSG